jgi:hypothetical protein
MCTVLPVAVANYGYSERNSALRAPSAVGGSSKKGVMLWFWKYILGVSSLYLGCPEFEVFRVPENRREFVPPL